MTTSTIHIINDDDDDDQPRQPDARRLNGIGKTILNKMESFNILDGCNSTRKVNTIMDEDNIDDDYYYCDGDGSQGILILDGDDTTNHGIPTSHFTNNNNNNDALFDLSLPDTIPTQIKSIEDIIGITVEVTEKDDDDDDEIDNDDDITTCMQKSRMVMKFILISFAFVIAAVGIVMVALLVNDRNNWRATTLQLEERVRRLEDETKAFQDTCTVSTDSQVTAVSDDSENYNIFTSMINFGLQVLSANHQVLIDHDVDPFKGLIHDDSTTKRTDSTSSSIQVERVPSYNVPNIVFSFSLDLFNPPTSQSPNDIIKVNDMNVGSNDDNCISDDTSSSIPIENSNEAIKTKNDDEIDVTWILSIPW